MSSFEYHPPQCANIISGWSSSGPTYHHHSHPHHRPPVSDLKPVIVPGISLDGYDKVIPIKSKYRKVTDYDGLSTYFRYFALYSVGLEFRRFSRNSTLNKLWSSNTFSGISALPVAHYTGTG